MTAPVRPLLVRPGEARVRTRLSLGPDLLAAAAASAATCRVPVDVAIWVAAEASNAVEDPVAVAARLSATVRRSVSGSTSSKWTEMLRSGCTRTDDTLPSVVMPQRLADVAMADLESAVCLAADTAALRVLLDAERTCSQAGLSLSEGLAGLAASPEAISAARTSCRTS